MRRSKDDTSDGAGRRSATGPGKPYLNRPEGSTRGCCNWAAPARWIESVGGIGDVEGAEYVDDAEPGGVGVGCWTRSSLRVVR